MICASGHTHESRFEAEKCDGLGYAQARDTNVKLTGTLQKMNTEFADLAKERDALVLQVDSLMKERDTYKTHWLDNLAKVTHAERLIDRMRSLVNDGHITEAIDLVLQQNEKRIGAPQICMVQTGCMGGVCGKLLPCNDHVKINEICWCPAKAGGHTAVCPLHG